MDVTFCNRPPSIEQWRKMREIVGWSICDENTFQNAIDNTLHFVSVYHHRQIIGMGRVIGDNNLCFYLQDIVVTEPYRNKGIGTQIVLNLLTYIKEHAHPKATIALMAHTGSENLYKSFGFICRPNNLKGPGMYMPSENYKVDRQCLKYDTYMIKI